ncbi:Mu transposase C-terminal domain-containing protein [Shewanella olleyana]|uniref:Mu transposase C-terminal domain-containing protein n=1 Tax=Shewanella olleyana TaxID=135626 RepID=UPI00200F88A8|nr:Mu transposase C-terminal domain-containing protein [Shewanella olleyana]MCL1068003.1 Mu transposase C-terminal domain-containing protein [Shewanella olleyana]
MLNLQLNQVYEMNEQKHRVLALPVEHVVLFNMDERLAEPETFQECYLENLAFEGEFSITNDPFAKHIAGAEFATEKDKEVRDRRYRVIKNIVEDSEFFLRSRRRELFRQAKRENNKKSKFVGETCRTFWRKGAVPNALIGKYSNSGAAGKVRTFVNSRTGPRAQFEDRSKAIKTDLVNKLFKTVIEKHYLAEGKKFSQTHKKFKNRYRTMKGDIKDEDIPTIEQMRQFYHTEFNEIYALRKRMDKHKYEKDVKAKSSTINTQVNGPADMFGVDTTLTKIHLVSAFDRTLIIGKPTLVLVKDVFSRTVVGWYLGFENPSYYSTVLALASAISDNTDDFKKAGFDNVPAGLVPVTMCQKISGDKGEIHTHAGDVLRNQFGVTFTASRSYGSDANGMIERAIRKVEESFEDDLPGVAEAIKAKKQGGKDTRLKAGVTLEELRGYVLEEILIHNQYADLSKSYDRDADMPVDLPLTPISLWKWGVKNRMGSLKTVSRKTFLLSMLPRETATISVKGVCVEGLYYWSDELEKKAFFEKNRELCPYDKLECIYDPSCMKQIIVILPGKEPQFIQCEMSDRSRFYDRSYSLQEIEVLRAETKKTDHETGKEHEAVLVDREVGKEDFLKEIRSKAPKGQMASDAARIGAIKANRVDAVHEERDQRMKDGGSIFDPIENPEEKEHQDDALYNPEVDELLKNKRT